jgi:hypothetical protein
MALEAWRDAKPDRRLMVDFRPHSHHWQVMRGVRASPQEVGMVDVAGAKLLCAMTSWGDGMYPVYTDRDQTGALVSVRLTLGDDGRRERLALMLRER